MKKIEKEMDRIIKKKLPIRQEVVSREEAKRHKFSKVNTVTLLGKYASALTFESFFLFSPFSCSSAKRRITELKEPYKLELLDAIPEGEDISIYHIGDEWWDLCAGPHVQDTGQIQGKALELERVSGAYWRGDELTKLNLLLTKLNSSACRGCNGA